jgi:hypothetical protein
MRNVDLRMVEGVVLRVTTLEGEFISRAPGVPPVFDDPTSYVLRLQAADLSMDARSLSALLNEQVFRGSKAPVKDLQLTIVDGAVKAKGKLHRGVDIPFSMTATVAATPDGRVRLHSTGIKAIGIPVKGMLDFFGVELEDVMKMPGGRGMQADGDDLLLAPTAMMPPPAMEGRLTAVRISGDRMVMTLTGPGRPPARPATLPDPVARNFLYFHSGSIRFGKLTMSDADLELVDADGRDPFDFYPARYKAQLVAGYSKNTDRGGLRTLMPDYGDLRRTVLPTPKLSHN